MGPMERLKVSQEGITVTNSTNTVSLWNLNKIKSEQAAKPGMEGSLKGQIVHRHHCSKLNIYIYIYIYIQKKKKKKKRKEKNQIGASVPIHHKSVPVQPTRKLAVTKVYRYTLNVYRYNLLKIGQ